MGYTNFHIKAEDGQKLVAYRWGNRENAPLVQILPGMAEHSGRYDDFASFLADNGFIVYSIDYRGHGKTGELNNSFGFFSEKNGWDLTLSDINTFTKKVREDHPRSRHFILGHSMGSMLLRDFLTRNFPADGAVLMGTGGHPGPIIHLAVFLARIHIFLFGRNSTGTILNLITNIQFNSHFEKMKTGYKWLSRDGNCEKNFVNDPLCQKKMSASFYNDLFYGVKRINNGNNLNSMKKDLPVLFISGDDDPVGDFGKGVRRVIKMFDDIKMTNTSVKFYKDARHEILNEINKEEVYKDILAWMKEYNK